ncbi:MAG: NHL repeat-containing protein [Trueperaceae bacterium]
MSVSIDPPTLTTYAGAPETTFTATVVGPAAAADVTWSLAGVGSISDGSGATTAYAPPATLAVGAEATLTAMVAGRSATALIDVATAAGLGSIRFFVTSDVPTSAGRKASLRVTGPSGYDEEVTGARTLIGLPEGSYSVVAADIQASENDIDAVHAASLACPEPAVVVLADAAMTQCAVEVVSGVTAAVTVEYARVEGTGALWIPTYFDGKVIAFPREQLVGGGSEPPQVSIEGASSAQSVAFDAAGNLWTTDWDQGQLRRFDAADLMTGGMLTPSVVIGGGYLTNPTGMAFDQDGSLWVTNRGNSTVVKFTADQIAVSGAAVVPAVVLGDDGSTNLSGPTALAFDADGDLWLSNQFSDAIFEYRNPGALAGAVTPSPDIVISGTIAGDPTLDAPTGLAFDENGSLWAGSSVRNAVVKFTAEQLQSSGTPVPDVTLGPTAGGLSGPSGLAFDSGGNLWVSNQGNAVLKFAPALLTASGAPEPTLALTGMTGMDIGLMAFNPPPVGLPVAGR